MLGGGQQELMRLLLEKIRDRNEEMRGVPLDDRDQWKMGEMPITPGMMPANFKQMLRAWGGGMDVRPPRGAKALNKAWGAEASGATKNIFKNIYNNLAEPVHHKWPIYKGIRDAKYAKFMEQLRRSAFQDMKMGPHRQRLMEEVARRQLTPKPYENAIFMVENAVGRGSGSSNKGLQPKALAALSLMRWMERLSNAQEAD
jgi:hypothetical protein